mmetsp:Transcript_174012/g.423332  ORF Transcript_174012/g.423332 Transcript_174012/m.423332 type:complete len:111 (-) Transcript_174012:984-1316(-)
MPSLMPGSFRGKKTAEVKPSEGWRWPAKAAPCTASAALDIFNECQLRTVSFNDCRWLCKQGILDGVCELLRKLMLLPTSACLPSMQCPFLGGFGLSRRQRLATGCGCGIC